MAAGAEDEAEPAWRARFCAACGGLSVAAASPCPRCRAAPIELRWREDRSGRPETRSERVWAVWTALWIAALIVGFAVMLVWIGGVVWRGAIGSVVAVVGIVIGVGLAGGGLWIAVEMMREGLRPLLWRRWSYSDEGGEVGGRIASLAGRWFRGEGATVVRARSVDVPGDIPGAAEVVRVGPGAVAAALAGALPRELAPAGGALTGTHALVIAAVLHLAGRGAARLSLVQRRSWRRGMWAAEAEWGQPGAIGLYAEPGAGAAPPGSIEAAMLAALRRDADDGGALDQARRTGPGGQDDPYRGPAPLEVIGRRVPIRLVCHGAWRLLGEPRAAGGSPAAGATAVAARLAAALAGDAELTATLIEAGGRMAQSLR